MGGESPLLARFMEAKAAMTERTFNFGNFSGLTVEMLTPHSKRAYIPARQQTTDGGLGGPVCKAARSRTVLPCGYFFALGAPLYGRTGRGGRKACRLLCPVRQPRSVPLTLLGGWVRGSFNEPEQSTMQATTLSVRDSRTIQRALRIIETHLQHQHDAALSCPGAVRDYLRTLIGKSEREEFVVLWLDLQNRLIKAETMFLGTLSACDVHPREVVRSAMLNNAGRVIFAHNHPSGAQRPSEADIQLTRSLEKALAVVDVEVLDHFIVTTGGASSMAELGAFKPARKT